LTVSFIKYSFDLQTEINMGLSYTAFYVYTFFALTLATVALDFLGVKKIKKEIDDVVAKDRAYLYMFLFKVLAEVALVWLVIAFIGQVLMGWISL